jgi:hypothetical protein
MERVHAFELEDLPWVPAAVKDGGRDLLDAMFSRIRFYRGCAPAIAALVKATGVRRLSDVCSGSGGGALAMLSELDALGVTDLSLELTDRYPNASAIERVRALADPRVRYRPEPADALDAPAEPGAIRTMFGAMHHFAPDDVRKILALAVDARAPVAVCDVAASPAIRKLPLALAPLAMIPNMALLLVVSLLIAPLARPPRLSRLLLCYVLPLIPALYAWDGTISALRAYAPDELLAIARSVPGADGYAWSCERAGPALVLTGRPAAG